MKYFIIIAVSVIFLGAFSLVRSVQVFAKTVSQSQEQAMNFDVEQYAKK